MVNGHLTLSFFSSSEKKTCFIWHFVLYNYRFYLVYFQTNAYDIFVCKWRVYGDDTNSDNVASMKRSDLNSSQNGFKHEDEHWIFFVSSLLKSVNKVTVRHCSDNSHSLVRFVHLLLIDYIKPVDKYEVAVRLDDQTDAMRLKCPIEKQIDDKNAATITAARVTIMGIHFDSSTLIIMKIWWDGMEWIDYVRVYWKSSRPQF